jgi:hypothetical protein
MSHQVLLQAVCLFTFFLWVVAGMMAQFRATVLTLLVWARITCRVGLNHSWQGPPSEAEQWVQGIL